MLGWPVVLISLLLSHSASLLKKTNNTEILTNIFYKKCVVPVFVLLKTIVPFEVKCGIMRD